ncbi:DUF6481 family protein [Paracoccus sp. SY]|uniref:DUF6481 family protein n=1 Tax=Paracoccus sp. SY TaxID=1330255 RepID=UPI000CCFE5A2|nr:DUF6481 family protein [Paracoccus sp. SY]
MKNTKKTELAQRQGTAQEAKAALLQAYKAAKAAAEPLREAKEQERAQIAQARAERRAAREEAKREEQDRLEAEAREREAAAAKAATAQADAKERAENRMISRVLDDVAMRKAMRDQRYAARKARQR